MIAGICLTGCSSGYDPTKTVIMGWDNGAITYNGKPTELTEYKGINATVQSAVSEYYFTLSSNCVSVVNITENYQDIQEDAMTKFEGKWYYLEYLGSKLTMAKNLGQGYYQVCQADVNGNEPGLIAKYASGYLDSFVLTENPYKIDFGTFLFGSDWDTPKMTNSACSITGTCKVSLDGHGCSTPVQITSDDGKKVKDVMMDSGDKYDYYEIDGYTVQIAKGLNIQDYIHIK